MAKPRFIKLGEKASSFSCPTTGTTLNKTSVLELTDTMRGSKKIMQALKGGHLEYADSEEVAEAKEKGNDQNNGMDRPFFESKTKPELLKLALKKNENDEDVETSEINGLKKDELIDYLLDEGDYASEEEEEEEE